jgi:hypothetical protein
MVLTPQIIITQPRSQAVNVGVNVGFNVSVYGTEPFSYQWYHNSVPITGANEATLVLTSVKTADLGNYKVVVTNKVGSVTSEEARLEFNKVLTLTAMGGSAVSRSPDQPFYAPNVPVKLNALPETGYAFSGWSGDATGAENPITVFMDRDKVITANFIARGSLSVQVIGQGTVRRSPDQAEYPDGTKVVLTARSAAGFEFVSWTSDISGKTNPIEIIVSRSKVVTAQFRDALAPVVTILSPLPGATNKENAQLTGSVTDNVGVSEARWERNGQAQSALTLVNGEFSVLGLRLAYGTNWFSILATDAAGNEGSAEVIVSWTPSRTMILFEPAEQQEGKKVMFPLALTSQGDVGAITFVVHYDTNFLTSPDLTWSALVGASFNQINYDSPGEVRATFALPATAMPPGSNLIATVSFRARSVPANLRTEIEVEVVDIASPSGDKLVYGTYVQNSGVRILKRQIIGGNNGNNRLDIGDATLIQRLLTRLDPIRSWDIAANDLNKSQDLDSGDVIRVLRTVVGIDPQPGLGLGLMIADFGLERPRMSKMYLEESHWLQPQIANQKSKTESLPESTSQVIGPASPEI